MGIALAGALTAGLASCGDGTGDAKPDGRLSAALDGIAQNAAGGYLTYWDVKESRRLLGENKELYATLDGYGIAELAQSRYESAPARTAHGFDETDVDTSVQLPAQAARLTGRFDVAAVTGALKKRGWTEEKTDGGVLLREEPAQVAVSASVRSSSFARDGGLPPLAAPERSVADDAAYQAVVGCIGEDAYHATFYGKDPKSRLPGLTLFAIGARAGDDGASRERLCALTQSTEAARGVADALKTKTAKGERFAGATVEVSGGETPMVTMEWANSTASGLRPGSQNQTAELPRLLMPPR
ncbi:hypothetical protein ACH4M4_21075 [Streptomyces sp. NPDC017254]|uniref:hypothetical protein n=1 Tax=unclassified Streptomyces TaxID=2593676 RepID=UPI0037AE4D02